MARQDFIDVQQVIESLEKSFRDVENAISDNAETLKRLQKEYNKLPSGFINAQKQLLDLTIKQSKAEEQLLRTKERAEKVNQQQINTTSKELRLQRQRELQLERNTKAATKEEQRLTAAASLYNKIQQQLNTLTKEYRDLAIQKELTNDLTGEELQRYTSLQGQIKKYDTALKSVDASMGKYGRSVGNYALGNGALQNSINQISRELPALAINTQTFFLAISNNLPLFFDAMKQTNAELKTLREQGEQVPSLFQSLKSSILSWGTALSVGVTLLTLFGDELVTWIGTLFEGNKAINSLKESTRQLNEIRVESIKSVVQERVALLNNLEIAKDTTLSYKEREIAADNILKQYPFWFENLGKEAIMNGKVEEAVKGVNEALLARAKSNAAITRITENQGKIIDVQEKQFTLNQNLQKAEERLASIRRRTYAASEAERAYESETNALADIQAYKEDIAELDKEINALEEVNNRLTEYSVENAKEAIGLDYQQEESQKRQIENLKDIQASAFALNQARLENEAAYNKQVLEDTENSYADREAASVRYGEILLELAQLRREEELRLLRKTTEDEIKELRRRAKEGEITQANANAVIKSLEEQSAYDRELIYENYSKSVIDANTEIQESLKGVWSELQEEERALRNIQFLNNNLREKKLLFDNVSGETTLKQFAELENNLRALDTQREDASINLLRSERESLDVEIEKLKGQEKNLENNQRLNELLKEQFVIDEQILQIETKRVEAVSDVYRSMKEATASFIDSVTSESLSNLGFSELSKLFDNVTYTVVNDLGEIETRSGSTFQKMFDQAQTFQEKFAVAFNAVTSIAQQAFAFINQASNASFQLEYQNLERRYEIAQRFAGESEVAQEEVRRQYEDRRREIRRRELEAQKEQAIFNATINIAQGITAALAQGPSGIPLSVVIAALGAAQIAFIASTQIPAYAEGTMNHTGGNMLVNDGKGSNYREMIVEPGKKPYIPTGRNRVINAKRGTKVFTAHQTKELQSLNGLLTSNDIAPISDVLTRDRFSHLSTNYGNGGITKEEMYEAVKNAMQQMTVVRQHWDRDGMNEWAETQTTRTLTKGNQVSFKGLST